MMSEVEDGDGLRGWRKIECEHLVVDWGNCYRHMLWQRKRSICASISIACRIDRGRCENVRTFAALRRVHRDR